jgi:hypothetical protein
VSDAERLCVMQEGYSWYRKGVGVKWRGWVIQFRCRWDMAGVGDTREGMGSPESAWVGHRGCG